MKTTWRYIIRNRKLLLVGASITSSALLVHNVKNVGDYSLGYNQHSKCLTLISNLSPTMEVYNKLPFPHNMYHASCKEIFKNEFIADVAEIALPAVVSIEVSRHYLNSMINASGSGSGFVVDSKKGYIITNEHVISGANNVTIVLQNGSQVPGSVVAIDNKTDLALIKVNTSVDLPQISMGDESKLRPGQWVVAIGNSLQFPNTVTAGIVSGVARNLSDHKLFSRGMRNSKIANSTFVQTDTTINPGNSGGPLINLDGEVIAVNTLTVGAVSGISFSIPISEVKRFLGEFSNKVHSTAPTSYVLGVMMISLSHEMIGFLHQNGRLDPRVNGGVFIHDTHENSPASKANLKKGDVIVAINNLEVYCRDDIRKAVENSKGNVVSITLFRPFQGFLTVKVKPAPVTGDIN